LGLGGLLRATFKLPDNRCYLLSYSCPTETEREIERWRDGETARERERERDRETETESTVWVSNHHGSQPTSGQLSALGQLEA